MNSADQLLLTLTLQAQRAGHQVTLRMDGDWVLVEHEGCPLRMPLEEALVYMVDVVGVDGEDEGNGWDSWMAGRA